MDSSSRNISSLIIILLIICGTEMFPGAALTIIVLDFIRHSGEDRKQLYLVSLELLKERLVQIQFGITEPVEMKQCLCFPMFRDLPKLHCNGAGMGA